MLHRLLPAALLTFYCFCSPAQSEEPAVNRNLEPPAPTMTLEGTLKIHPKFLYRYYISDFGGGQGCALFGLDDQLKDIKPGSWIEVQGKLGSRLHEGDTPTNLSPFPRTWYIYMDVESVKVLRDPLPPSNPPSQPLPGTKQ